MSVITYRPDIDGLRALAIIPVLLFHLGANWLPGGFLGVDVFFVISGYLITSIILKDHDSGRFSYTNFWMRRIRRIFPLLAIMVIVTLIVSYFLTFKPDLQSIGKVGLSSIFSVANMALWRMTSYWGPAAENSPFLHSWSLSVEEQFYLIYPAFLLILLKYMKHHIVMFLSLTILASFFLFLYTAETHPTASFYLLPMRGWELACGCLLAVLHFNKKLKLSGSLSIIAPSLGFLLIIYSYVSISGENGLSALQALSVLGSLLIIMGHPESPGVSRTLSTALPVFIGKISYSLYMWHWPIIVLANGYYFRNGQEPSVVVLMLSIVIVSVLSYNFIEKTTREMKRIIPLAVFLLLISCCLSIYFTFAKYDVHYATTDYDVVEYYGQMYDVSPVQPPIDRALKLKRTGIIAPKRESWAEDVYASGGIIRNYGKANPDIMLLGDSHGLMWAKVIDEICRETNISVALNGMTATNPFFSIPLNKKPPSTNRFSSEQKYLFDKARYNLIRDVKPSIVIIVSRWSFRSKSEVDDLITYIGNQGSKVLLIEQPPPLFIGNNNSSQYFAFMGIVPTDGTNQYIRMGDIHKYQEGRKLVHDLAKTHPHVELFEVAQDLLSDNNKTLVMENSKVLYYDDDHLSYQGTTKFKTRLMNTINSMTQTKIAKIQSNDI